MGVTGLIHHLKCIYLFTVITKESIHQTEERSIRSANYQAASLINFQSTVNSAQTFKEFLFTFHSKSKTYFPSDSQVKHASTVGSIEKHIKLCINSVD